MGNKVNTPCIVCDSAGYRPSGYGGYLYQGIAYDIVSCANCGFMFLNPLPSKDTVDELYKQDSYFDNYYAAIDGVKGYIEGMDLNGKQGDSQTLKLLKRFKVRGRLLDIGCAAGRFLLSAQEAGYQIFGIEPNASMVNYARAKLGLDVKCGILEDLPLNGNLYDIIRTADVLEHLQDIKKGVNLIKKILAVDGIWVIEQPLMYNISAFSAALKLYMMFKKSKYSSNPPFHLWEFNARTLKIFLKRMGFEIIYFSVSERKPQRVANSSGNVFPGRMAYYFKKTSAAISRMPISRSLNFGDRALVLCRKEKGL